MLALRQYPQGAGRPACHCGLDPQSRGADGKRHAEYLLDTTVAQARTDFKAVSRGAERPAHHCGLGPESLGYRQQYAKITVVAF